MKKTYIFLVLIFSFCFVIVNVNSLDQSISLNYYNYNSSSVEKTVDFSNIMLKISTDEESVCRYSVNKGILYSNMEGYFDYTSGKIHEKGFTNLGDGFYKYYIKCMNNTNSSEPIESEIVVRVNSLVNAKIILSKEPPLKSGKVDITLLTSKLVSQTPSLSYTFDSISYSELPLFGSEKVWKSYLIVSPSSQESVVSFKFKANDLEGRQGTELTSGGVFAIDTIKPRTISFITGAGIDGKIKLDWYYDEIVKGFNIYKSESPNPDYTNFFKIIDRPPFYDNFVEKGKTYYYRVSAVDDAGNEADLSREISVTALIDNQSSSFSGTTGLKLEYQGYVDSLLTDINSIIQDITDIKSSISQKQEKERNLFLLLKLDKEIDNGKSELDSLKKEVERYKLQDITKEELNKKLDSARLKMEIIKKKIPENLIISGEDSINEEIKEEDIRNVILELEHEITDKLKEKSVQESLKLLKDSNFKTKSLFYLTEIVYIDGTKKEITVIDKKISAELEKKENTYLVETISKEIVGSASEIDMKNLDYTVVKEDPIISFPSDTKEITYVLNKKSSFSSLKTSKLIIASVINENPQQTNSGFTGYFIYATNNKSYFGIILISFLSILMVMYLIYVRKNKPTHALNELSKQIETSVIFLEKKELKNAEEIYSSLIKDYKYLNKKEKKKAFKDLSVLYDKILFFRLKDGLQKLELSKDKNLLVEIEKIFEKLSEKSKEEISHHYYKIKRSIEHGNF